MKPSLRTRYLGLDLRSPIVASPSPDTGDLDVLRRLEEAGIGAVVLPSLFEEQIEHEEMELTRLAEFHAEEFPEAMGYFPALDDYNTGPGPYLERLAAAKEAVSVPVIASLNGHTSGGWVHYARQMEEAGADALELNVTLVPTDPTLDGAAVEARHVELVESVRASVRLPLAVKIVPQFSAPANFALRLVEAGADGLVLFNRQLRPDLDLEAMQLVPRLDLSTSADVRTALQWIGILRDHTQASLAASTGVHEAHDALKALLVGADVAMTTAALLRRGPGHVRVLLDGMLAWMQEREYESVDQLRGSMSRENCPDPSAYERANYMRTLLSWTGVS